MNVVLLFAILKFVGVLLVAGESFLQLFHNVFKSEYLS